MNTNIDRGIESRQTQSPPLNAFSAKQKEKSSDDTQDTETGIHGASH